MIAVDSEDPQREYDLLREELTAHSAKLADKPHCLILTKSDLLGPDDEAPSIDAPDAWGRWLVSAASRQGLGPMLDALWARTREESEPEDANLPYRP
jgi:GTP-binding protein